tara:strand:+ start:4169 stop:4738 length:570 start_codon:yes stop_codon:yes gene_type:complete
MRRLFENWKNYMVENKLRVFDFDDTLVQTDGMIGVTRPGEEKTYMTPGEYAVYEPDGTEDFDFSQFGGELINPREIPHVTKIFRRVLDAGMDGRKVVILTARASNAKPAIEGFISQMGYDPSSIEIVTLGDSDPFAKSAWIDNQIQQGFKRVYFTDDSRKNVDAVAALKDKYAHDPEIKIRSQHVKETE